MSQDYISALFDGLFFIIVGILMLVSSAFVSYEVFLNGGFIAAMTDFYPGMLWSGGFILIGLVLYRLSLKGKQPLVFDRYS